jgi:hypothetical protein
MKIFVDCDVLIDVSLGRKPFCLASGELLDYLEKITVLLLGILSPTFSISLQKATINNRVSNLF